MPAFRMFGFPVRVRLGFVAFLAVVVIWNPEVGWKFALAVTLFSLLHELGHAVAARRLGAAPEIALDFFAGSTRYTPTRPITPLERAAVAITGPAVEVAAGLLALALLRVNPLDIGAVFDSTIAAVVWIAGPVFGLLNLLPILPLDGGQVLSGALETIWPARGRAAATVCSGVLTFGLCAFAFAHPDLRWLAPFTLMLVALQFWPLLPVRSRRTRADVQELVPVRTADATQPEPDQPETENVGIGSER